MTDEPRNPDSVAGPITFALLILIGFLAIHSSEPPSALDENAPATEFSAARAMRDVREIAKKPHPLGSAENDRVREYLVGRLRELGANPEVQTTTVARHTPFGPDTWAVVNNVVAKIPGTNTTGAVLMVAHYDSVPSSPGAGDNAASIAAILESMRALKAGAKPLRNDLIILFTDGEELGLLGAQGFVETSPALQRIKLVLNLEMRGDYGQSVMFQSKSNHSGFATNRPIWARNSFAESLYWTTMNETDLSVFLDAGMDGVSFGALQGITRYKTKLDNAELLDQRTLQQQGTYALSMTRRFGTIDLTELGSESAASLVESGSSSYYLTSLQMLLAILVSILLLGVIWTGIRDGRFSVGGIAAGFAIYVIAIVAAIVEARIIWRFTAMLAGWRMLPAGTTYGGFYYSLATDALIFGTLWAAYALISRSIRLQNLGAGALVVLTVPAIAATIAMPATHIFLWWPLLFASLAIGYSASATDDRVTIRRAVLALVALALATDMVAPSLAFASADGTMVYLIYGGISAALLFGWFIPYTALLSGGRRWILPGVLGLVALAMIIKGTAASNFDAAHPHPDSIFYFLDSDRGRARWVSLDSRPDAFSSQFFQHHVRGGWLPKLAGLATRETPERNLASTSGDFAYLNRGRTTEGDALLVNIAPPELKVLDDSTISGERTVKMHIASARKASIIWMSVPVGVTVLGASIDGKSAGDRITDGWSGWYWRAPPTGFDLTLKLATPAPFVVTVIDQTDGLPDTPGFAIRPRPPDTMPTPFLFFDSTTLVRRTYAIGGEQVTRR